MRARFLSGLALAAAITALAAIPTRRVRADEDTSATAGRATSTGASGDDYLPSNTGWNGGSRLVELIHGLGLDVVAPRRTLWRSLGRNDVVLMLYPTRPIDAGDLDAFIAGGGHVLIADDFGAATEAMSRLGFVLDGAAAVDAARYYDGLPYAPLAHAWAPKHPLADGVSELATNHPAIMTDVSGATAVFGFGRGQAVVAAGERGRGRFVALSDPSVFINRMLQFGGNLDFAVNVIRFLSTPRTHRVVLLTGDFALTGQPPAPPAGAGIRGETVAFLGGFNRWLDGLNDYLVTVPALRVAAVAFALLVIILGVAALPPRRRARLDGSWARAHVAPGPPGDVGAMLARLGTAGARENYLAAAAVLRDNVNARLAVLLGVADPLWSVPEPKLCRAVEARAGSAAAQTLRAAYSQLRGLPTRDQTTTPWQTRRLSRRQFERLHASVRALYRSLGGTG